MYEIDVIVFYFVIETKNIFLAEKTTSKIYFETIESIYKVRIFLKQQPSRFPSTKGVSQTIAVVFCDCFANRIYSVNIETTCLKRICIFRGESFNGCKKHIDCAINNIKKK